MTEFQEDMLFKNVSEEDIQILLEILEKESESANIWTKELRLLDPTTYKPDLIIELDDENLIIEFQSTEVNDKFSRRAHTYVAITDQKKENDKEVNIEVISTAENSKQISYRVNRLNTFRYNVIGFEKYDGEKIIKYVEEKLENNMKITSKDNIYLSLAPLMDKKKNNNISEKIKRVVDLLIELNKTNPPGNKLSFGITWLLVDKFVKDSELRNLLIDVLGEKMSAIYEYGERKEINDQLDNDVVSIIQPLVTKYSNLNKEYKSSLSEEEYAQKRLEVNKNLEKELREKIPYLDSREIKKIVIEFSREQDKMN